jgi:hypothetical protein
MKMQDKPTSRREALGIATLAASFVMGAATVEASPAKPGKSARPSREDLARARRLYGGELGGFKGER